MNADGIKLTSYFGERNRVNGAFVADALLDLYSRHDIAASIMLRGIRGFGLNHHLRTNSSLSLSENLPLTAIAVGARPNIEAVLNQTLDLNQARPRHTRTRPAAQREDRTPSGIEENAGEATKLTAYFSRRDSVYMVPAFEEICELLYRRGIPGATALLGVDGIAHGRRQRTRFFSRNADLPMMVVAVGPGDRIGMVLPELAGLLRHPLMTLERVRVCKRDGQFINIPELAAEADDHGFPLWQKLPSTPRRRPGTTASRSTASSYADYVRPGSAAPRPTADSGVSMVSARRTAIVSCGLASMYQWSRR